MTLYSYTYYLYLLLMIVSGKELSWLRNVNHYVPNKNGLAFIDF